MFGRLADAVVRRHRLIIIFWIVLLLVALPLAPQLENVLVYDDTEMAPGDLRSERAMDFIRDEFGGEVEGADIIVVLASPDVLDNHTRSAIYSIQRELFNATHDGRIQGKMDVSSLYSRLTDYSAGLLMDLSRSIPEVQEGVNGTADMVFGLPMQFRNVFQEANVSSYILYGIPSLHLSIWQELNASSPGEVDQEAYDQTVSALQSSEVVANLNSTMRALAWDWFKAYVSAWNISAIEDPQRRAEESIANAFPGPISRLSDHANDLFQALRERFCLGNYSDFHDLSAFALSQLERSLDPTDGSSPSEYLEIFYPRWNASSSPGEDFRRIVDLSAREYGQELGGEAGELVAVVNRELGLADWNDSAARESLAAQVVSDRTGAAHRVVGEVLDLGPSPSPGTLYDMARELAWNTPLDNFPLPIPSALMADQVNPPANDTTLMYIQFQDLHAAEDSVGMVKGIVHSTTGDQVTALVTGGAAISEDMSDSMNRDLERIDPVAVVLILILIGLFFRSVVASSVPPMSIGLAIVISMALVFLIGEYLLAIHYSVLAVMITAMLGAGCDYCIFILSRYREERLKGENPESSVRTAVTWAGEAVATSGMTVMIGFGSLALGRFGLMRSMGIGLGLGILIALLVALTLLPSILTLLGDRLFWPTRLDGEERRTKGGDRVTAYFARSARFSVKHAKAIVLAALLISVPATYLALTLDTSYDFIAGMPDNESKRGLEAMGDSFGEGRINPTLVAIDFSSPVFEGGEFDLARLDRVESISQRLANLSNVREVTSPTRPLGEPIEYGNLSAYSDITAQQYRHLMRGMVGENDTSVLVTVVLTAESFAPESIDLVTEVRQVLSSQASLGGVQATYVAGGTANMYDISTMVQEDFDTMRWVVVGGVYLVLLVVLGSVLIPLRLILTILLSISWTIALTMLVFIHLVGTPILWLMPMIVFVVTMGLGMDYDVFLTTRIREEVVRGYDDREAIVRAVEGTGKIITACGLIMSGAFASMMLSSTSLLQEFGFALAFAILLDATLVRIYLVPAIMVLLEGWNWWAPGRLQRVGRK
ncbi:MAG: MMPL family transporter [Methanomassiliicoccales archaeon]